MGFDLARFIGQIDEEFQCSICLMVLKNPVQSPCDHLFCSECIKDSLSIDKSCPVDTKPLAITDLKPIQRTIRNILDKLEIKCDFDSQGCHAVVKLEGLEEHLASCEYNPDALIVCDKGCNLEMSRREYRTSNCLAHLASDHKKEIVRIMQENSPRQGEEIERLSNEVLQLRQEKHQLEYVARRQVGEKTKLSKVLQQLRQQQKISFKPPMIWGLIFNVKSPMDRPDILELGDECRWGSVRSSYALEPKNSNFKVHILNGDQFAIGLSVKGVPTHLGDSVAFYYNQYGSLSINKVDEYKGPKCKSGDVIELGIKFPLNFVNDGNASVQFYLSINERVATEKLVKMPIEGIYPTIFIYWKDTKIEYFGS